MAITFEEAKKRLAGCIRHECRDHAFGDAEITWTLPDDHQKEVAFCYLGGGSDGGVSIYEEDPDDNGSLLTIGVFEGEEARELRKLGVPNIGRNDSTGPDDFVVGRCMPGLTLVGVKKELTEKD